MDQLRARVNAPVLAAEDAGWDGDSMEAEASPIWRCARSGACRWPADDDRRGAADDRRKIAPRNSPMTVMARTMSELRIRIMCDDEHERADGSCAIYMIEGDHCDVDADAP